MIWYRDPILTVHIKSKCASCCFAHWIWVLRDHLDWSVLVNKALICLCLYSETVAGLCQWEVMRLVILDDYDLASEWAAKYIRNRIIHFKPSADRYFTLGLPTGNSPDIFHEHDYLKWVWKLFTFLHISPGLIRHVVFLIFHHNLINYSVTWTQCPLFTIQSIPNVFTLKHIRIWEDYDYSIII